MRLRGIRMYEPKSTHEVTLPLALANWIFGIGIIEYPQGRSRPFISFLYSMSLIVCFCTMMIQSLEHMDEWYVTSETPSEKMIYRAIFYGNVCLAIITILLGWIKAKGLKQLKARLSESEEKIERIGIPKLYKKIFYDQIFKLFGILVTIVVYMIIIYNWMLSDATPVAMRIGLTFTLQYPTVMMYMVDVTFATLVKHIGYRFQQLNGMLREMLTTTPESPQHRRVLEMYADWDKSLASIIDPTRRTKENVNVMREAKLLHLELVKVARCANSLYGLEILLSMTVAFVLITGLLYNVYIVVWLDQPYERFLKEIISLGCWIFFYVSKIILINHYCAATSTLAATTGDVICELYEPSTSAEFRAEIRDFTLQLIQNPLTFTASGFFTLDYTFVYGVVGSVTTYLVILIQFSDVQNNGKPKKF